MSNEMEQFLNGSGVPGAKFVDVGDTAKGTVTAVELVQQTEYGTGKPKSWEDGKPMMQLAVTITTDERDPEIGDDDGSRRLFIKGASKKAGGGSLAAVRDALRAVGASGIEVGGTLALQYAGEGEKTNPLYNAPKLWKAQYKAPEAKVAEAFGLSQDELI